MKLRNFVRGIAVCAAAVGLFSQSLTFAADSVPTPPVIDVALDDGGVLHGQVVDLRGTTIAKAPVSFATQKGSVAGVMTASDGSFKVPGLKGGVYQVSTVQGRGVYRLWSPGTAPPAAQKAAIVYAQNQAVDSNHITYTQGGGGAAGGVRGFVSSPIFIAGAVATAVAVPVAIANSHSASP